MTREEALAWLYSTRKFGIKLGLENIYALLGSSGNPHHNLRCAHVAGTNGKGSVCAFLDAAARAAGLRCGLYTSPHLVNFEERIRINGEQIPSEALAEGLTSLRAAGETLPNPPTFFEYATALAFGWFAEQSCEFAVVETGMGGRLDATNSVDPLVSVITPISLDHAEWLGSTPEAIASEKAGIIKPGRPVVSADQLPGARRVLELAAEAAGAPITFIGEACPGELGLKGPHQRRNASLARAAIEAARLPISPEAISRGFASARWPGRFETRPPGYILDGAHNPHAARALAETWRSEFGNLRVPVIFGCLGDKDAAGILAEIAPLASRFLFVPIRESQRAVPPGTFAQFVGAPYRVFEALPDALADALPSPGTPTLITGSLFLIGEVTELLP